MLPHGGCRLLRKTTHLACSLKNESICIWSSNGPKTYSPCYSVCTTDQVRICYRLGWLVSGASSTFCHCSMQKISLRPKPITPVSSYQVRNKSATSWQLPRLRESYGETCLMDFGHYYTFSLRRKLSRRLHGYSSFSCQSQQKVNVILMSLLDTASSVIN